MNPSFPRERILFGVTIRKLRLGRFLEALDLLAGLPGHLLTACFPGRTLDGALLTLSACDGEGLRALLSTALHVAPREIVRVFAGLVDVLEEELLENEEIGPVELLQIFEAFAEVNGLGNFMMPAHRIIRLFAGDPPKPGERTSARGDGSSG